MSLPNIAVMWATEIAQPFHWHGWACEEKHDGWRMLAYKGGTAFNRPLKRWTGATPVSYQRQAARPSRVG